ncbi:MAG: hypothetical protein M1818_006872 [Claussenomyces sp. TS43310]|nr:MAG: hypothetical protein M1818_006872 [Claussenomyces sp. TS43310]
MSPPNNPPNEDLAIIQPALQIGLLSGLSGLFFGGVSGVLRATTPLLFSLATGIQWFTLGSTFWAARGVILHSRKAGHKEPHDLIVASALAGGIGGGAGGLLRGRKNVVPGAIVFAIFGSIGQAAYNMADARHSQSDDARKVSPETSWMSSRWSPIKVLSDAEYEKMLQEKLLRVNAEIALVDEDMERLRTLHTNPLAEVKE